MAKPNDPKPAKKKIVNKRMTGGTEKIMKNINKGPWKGVRRKTEPTNTVKRK